DLASEFQADFFDAVKVLEDFSSSDSVLKDAMADIRQRITAKMYVCAPNFWGDLRSTLKAIEEQRNERTSKSKAQQVLKHVARLEVKFWAKASVAMLKELDPESRIERIVDWLQTFGLEEEEDSSSGPAVLYQVLSDVTLQKDFDVPQREALSIAVRENLQKFPVEMQAVLERVGSVTGGPPVPVSDWRRRHNQTTQLESPTLGPGAALLFGVGPELTNEHAQTSVPNVIELTEPDGPDSVAEVQDLTAEEEAANTEIRLALWRELAEQEKKASAEESPADESTVMPYSADPFADLLATIMIWLQQAGGTLEREAVLPLIRAMGFRVRAVIQGLSQDVFWSHPEAECEILLRTAAGTSLHPKPLPANYLHEAVRRNLVLQVRQMGSKAKYDKLAGLLGWNAKSELRRTYGALRIVLAGLPEIFYDSQKLYLKQVLEGVVDWPVGKDGRMGPNTIKETVQHWTRACDDLKGAGDVDWFNAKRQLLGVVMNQGGHCDVQVARWLLQPAGDKVTLEKVFEAGSQYDLTKVLFWEPRRAFRRRQPMAAPETCKASPELCQALRQAVDTAGVATIDELKAAVASSPSLIKADEHEIVSALQEITEVFFMPEHVFLRHVANGIILQSCRVEDVADNIDEDEEMMREGLAEVAAAAAAIKEPEEDPLQIKAPNKKAGAAVSQVQSAGMDLGFFNFTGFETTKAEPDPAPPAAKKPKLVPAWLTEGAAVQVRGAQAGTILEVKGDLCRVRTLRLEGDVVREAEEMLPLPALIPVAPEVGRSVKVVAGDRTGIIGKLVGLAGAEAVLQIAGMCYETLPMTQIAVVSD
ncbi:unnamed protein product, partial [Symbiodinium pilosum]